MDASRPAVKKCLSTLELDQWIVSDLLLTERGVASPRDPPAFAVGGIDGARAFSDVSAMGHGRVGLPASAGWQHDGSQGRRLSVSLGQSYDIVGTTEQTPCDANGHPESRTACVDDIR